jgi:hypothetical protein
MPVQPLNAMAAIMLAQRRSGGVLASGGLVIGVATLVFARTGTLGWLTGVVPKDVIRGFQFGLGIALAMAALKNYVSADAGFGYVFAFLPVALLLVFRRQKKDSCTSHRDRSGCRVCTCSNALSWWRINSGLFAPEAHDAHANRH